MGRVRASAAIAAIVALSACYHAVIDTGRPAGKDSINIPWAHSFIFGLIPPAIVDAAQKCPNGVAKVETQHSFLNGLVAVITFSLYTPIQINVACASGGRASIDTPTLNVGRDLSAASALDQAAAMAVAQHTAVLVHF
jgi:hypothetical protein